ncbi:MAG: SH3 domain-containing protein [Anaerolineae bacterium]|nr:SH3 domain-containing protein [Anaerolineae bacterium]
MRKIINAAILSLGLIIPFVFVTAQSDGVSPECTGQGIIPVALIVGENGQVAPGDANNVRDIPSRSGTQVGAIPAGEMFAVLDGPVCADGFAWWQVDYQGLTGWTVDGADGVAWLLPVEAADVSQPAPEIVQIASNVISPANVASLSPIRELTCDTGATSSGYFVISPDQRYIAIVCPESDAGSIDQDIGILDLVDGQQVTTLKHPEENADERPIRFLADGSLLYRIWSSGNAYRFFIASNDGTEWSSREIEEAEAVQLLMGEIYSHPLTLYTRQLSENDERIAALREDRTIGTFAFSPDENRIALLIDGEDGPTLQIVDALNGDTLVEQALNFDPALILTGNLRLFFSPSGNFVLGQICTDFPDTGFGWDCEPGQSAIIWWDAATATEVERWMLPEPHTIFTGIPVFNPQGNMLAVPTEAGILFYDVNSDEPVFILPRASDTVQFSPDGTFIVASGARGTVASDELATTIYAVP